MQGNGRERNKLTQLSKGTTTGIDRPAKRGEIYE